MRLPGASLVEDGLIWLAAAGATVYLGLSGGGYDIVVRSELGIAIWWVVLLLAVAGLLPRSGLPRLTGIALVPLVGFFAWTWLGTGWTSSQELTLVEVARVATYAGTFVLAALVVASGSGRTLLAGVAAGIAIVCVVAVLSKLVPAWFPADPTASVYATGRLRYPFDYSDGVGEFAALGLPLLLYLASSARTLWARMLSAGALPVILLCLELTLSRGGILAAAVGVIAFLILAPDRLPRVATSLLAAGSGAALMLGLVQRRALTDQVTGAAPAGQRHSMLVILAVAVVLVAVAQGALALAGLHDRRPGWTRASRRVARAAGFALAGIVAVGVAVLFASGEAHQLWEQFKQPNPPVTSRGNYFRVFSLAGSHRYQYWQVAMHAFHAHPVHGIGPGTFQFYWAEHQKLGEYVLNAHSLWVETLAELGIVGLVLLAGFFLLVVAGGALRGLHAEPTERSLRTAAVSAVAAFCAAAAFDWVWEIGVMPMLTMALAAVALGPAVRPASGRSGSAGAAGRVGPAGRADFGLLRRLLLAAGAAVALWVIAVPLATTVAVRRSQTAARHGQLTVALRDAASASGLEPAAATPWLQRALLLEQANQVPSALSAVARAQRREPTDWRIWLIASRLETEADHPALALSDYLRAKRLNPTSPLFAR